MFKQILFIILASTLGSVVVRAADSEPGFVSIFNGRDLHGWDSKPGAWEVRNGEIWCTGASKGKNWLIWRGGEPADFVLRLEFRWDKGNSGVQVRSDDLGKWQVFGYQVEIAKADVMGLWHHSLIGKDHPKRKARFLMSTAGEKAVIEEDGTRANTQLADAAEVQAKYKEHEWNTLEIIAKGDQLVQRINGHHFATLVDQDAEMSRRKGFIAFQDHGKGCTVAFRNIRLKEITAASNGDDEDVEEDLEEGTLERMAFKDLPVAVRKKARREFPDEPLLAVERSRDDRRVNYHVMFEVDGTEAGLRMTSRGEILDRWQFQEEETAVPPTHVDIKYGPHDRNVLDLWLAESDVPTPLLICIHGGGFSGGDKRGFRNDDLMEPMLEAGISVAAINYRLTEGGKNPYPIPMLDGARAVQYLRRHAEEYNFDKQRFGATGGSAGGCMLMWLGFHPDLAKPNHKDPVLRESSRLQALAPYGGQSCLHLPTLATWFGVASLRIHPAYGPLFGLSKDDRRKSPERFDAAMRDASPVTHLTADDPPIYLRYEENRAVHADSSPDIWVHHRIMGTKLKERMDKLKIECHVEYPEGGPISDYSSQYEFIIRKLTR